LFASSNVNSTNFLFKLLSKYPSRPHISNFHKSFSKCFNSSKKKIILYNDHKVGIHFSNLELASVLIPNLSAVFLIETLSKFAISTKIFLVFSSTPEFNHQTIQAKAKTFSSSAITISSSFNLYSFPKRSTKFSHSLAFLTTILPFTLSASKK